MSLVLVSLILIQTVQPANLYSNQGIKAWQMKKIQTLRRLWWHATPENFEICNEAFQNLAFPALLYQYF